MWAKLRTFCLRWRPRSRVLKALLEPRPKGKPPVNYNPNSLWRDFFDLSKKDKP